ncbi:CpaF family protein [Roseibaca sp. Y0-43]|nr:CpaF family protein [Roseibaca sp. Y0-43]
MFGKKTAGSKDDLQKPSISQPTGRTPRANTDAYERDPVIQGVGASSADSVRELKRLVFARLVEVIDAAQLLRMDVPAGRAHIAHLLNDIVITEKLKLTATEEQVLLDEISDDMLGFGPLERFLSKDNVSDIMVYGTEPIYIEVDGVMKRTDVRFRDNEQLYNVCQRIVSLVGRRVDESSPICDARLKDGSRVNVIVPPISLHGPALTIRRFRKDMVTINQMVDLGTISAGGAELLRIIARTRCNLIVVGGTGSGKTTLLNVMAGFIEPGERIVTCEDTAELQLSQPHVVRLETRPPNIERKGEITMRDLVRNCLRMRPDRIVVGEVRGPEAFDLLQAMNTGHDGSMGTLHANTPEEAFSRITALVTMGYGSLSPEIIEKMFVDTIDVIVSLQRMRDGTRRVTQIAEVVDLKVEGAKLNTLLTYDMGGEQSAERITGRHVAVNAPRGALLERAAYYGESKNLMGALVQDGLDERKNGKYD